MATGTGNLPNQNQDAVPFTTLTAQFYDETIENIESVADGSGIGDGAIGYTQMSTPIAFSAYQSASQSVAITTFTKVQLQTEEFDDGSRFDNATNYRFTANTAGVYQFNGAASLGSMADGHRMFVTLYKNGSEFKRGVRTHSSASDTLSSIVSSAVKLAVNDYIEMYIWQTSGGSKTTSNDFKETYLNGYKVR